MRYEWDEAKRLENLRTHGLDFVDVARVFAGPTFTFEDHRFPYSEPRFITLGLLKDIPVSLAHTESDVVIRPISFRKATNYETEILFEKIADQLPPPSSDEGRRRRTDRGSSGGRRKAYRSRHRQKGPKGRSS
jgi:uncharacterized protein